MTDRQTDRTPPILCTFLNEGLKRRIMVFFTYFLTYLLTYLLTPWRRVLLVKLTGLQLVKKFPAFHGTQRFITALSSVRHLSLSWASPIQCIYPHPTSWRSILILSTHLLILLLLDILFNWRLCLGHVSK